MSPPPRSRIYEGVLTGQMRETRRPVVAISLSGSNRSLSWTTGNTHNDHDHVISEINHTRVLLLRAYLTLTALTTAFCALHRAQFELAEEVCCREDPHQIDGHRVPLQSDSEGVSRLINTGSETESSIDTCSYSYCYSSEGLLLC